MAVAPLGLTPRDCLPFFQQNPLDRDVHFHTFRGHLHQHTNSEQNIDQLISINSFWSKHIWSKHVPLSILETAWAILHILCQQYHSRHHFSIKNNITVVLVPWHCGSSPVAYEGIYKPVQVLCLGEARKSCVLCHFYSMCRQMWVCKLSKIKKFHWVFTSASNGMYEMYLSCCQIVALIQSINTQYLETLQLKNHLESVDFHSLVC